MSKPLTYGLLLSILMVIAPHAAHLPLWVDALCATLLLWRTYLVYSGSPLPKRWLLTALTAVSAAVILISFHTLFGREAGVTLLMLLTALKLMEMRTRRDAMALIYLSCFIIVTNFFYSQSIPTALYMLATLTVVVTAWVHLQAQNITLKPRLRIAAILLLQAIPLTLILFVLFPRVQGPLWGLPQDAFASSGLDDKMSPGSLSRLGLSNAVAFRVSYANKPPPRDQMYWRGPVLWSFDGLTWTQERTAFTVAPQFTGLNQAIDYTVTLEPHNKKWLFTLDMPNKISIPAGLTYDFQVLSKEQVHSRLRYEARSYLGFYANLREAGWQIQRALQLPQQLNPRARQLAATWRAEAEAAPPPQPSDETTSHSTRSPTNSGQAAGYPGEKGGNRSLAGIDETIVRQALAYFNQQGFQYTLEPPPLGINGIDDFMFTTRKGFCEHYASAFVFLMRAAHIPARVVTGYQGGEFNYIGNYYIVRQSDAHAWAEVWLNGRGWVRFDPTAAIAPARVQTNVAAAIPASETAALPFMARVASDPPQWLINLRLNWDMLAFRWNQWVLGYNTELQFAFLTRLGMENITWQGMAVGMGTGIGMVIALFALFMLRHLFARHPDKVQDAWLRLCRKLAKAGLPRAAHEGARDYAARIAAARPEIADAIHDIAARYSALRYENHSDLASLQSFKRAIAAFKL